MKKKSAALPLLLSVLTLASCTGGDVGEMEFFELEETDVGTNDVVTEEKLAALGYTETNPLRIALVTDSGTLNDHSFNESAWNGVNQFATENGNGTVDSASNTVTTGLIQTMYYQPAKDGYNTQGRLTAMRSARDWGADVIVLPGFLFQSAIKAAIDDGSFNDIAILALDCVKEDSDNGNAAFEFTDNITSVIYREEQSGFLAGYGAVMDGYRQLGYVGGMAVPAVVRYGSGFCQGADYAAKELGLTVDEDGNAPITIQYYYAGEFAATAAATQNATTWYNNGTEVIFAAGGAVYQSVTSAVTSVTGDKKWIGVDVNQHADSSLGEAQDLCITSAMKNLTQTTKILLADWANNDQAWNDSMAGEVITVGAKSGNCVLPTPETTGDEGCWGFETFTVDEYNEVLADLQNGTIKVNSFSEDAVLSVNNFGCSELVKVNYIA